MLNEQGFPSDPARYLTAKDVPASGKLKSRAIQGVGYNGHAEAQGQWDRTRLGIFGAKIGSMHRYRTTVDQPGIPAGTVVTETVQDISMQPEEVQKSAMWLCTFPGCSHLGPFKSKAECFRAHLPATALASEGEWHMCYAIGEVKPSADVPAVTRKAKAGDSGFKVGDDVIVAPARAAQPGRNILLSDEE
jgi:hypothetical protein